MGRTEGRAAAGRSTLGRSLRSVVAGAGLLLAGVLAGCVAPLVPIDADEPIELSVDEGIVVFFVDSNANFSEVDLGRRSLRNVGPGTEIRTYVAEAGHYRWSAVHRSRLSYYLRNDDAYWFEVRAGHLNYPGHLTLFEAGSQLWVRAANRSSHVVDHFVDHAPVLFELYPAVYSGPVRDDFLGDYQALWRARGREKVAE